MTARRQFIQWIPLAGMALVAARGAQAAAPMVDPKEAGAVALGYVAETAKADGAKYKNHTAAQMCGNCQLFQGKAGDAAGGCPLFAGKQVAAGGWCSAYAKKA